MQSIGIQPTAAHKDGVLPCLKVAHTWQHIWPPAAVPLYRTQPPIW